MWKRSNNLVDMLLFQLFDISDVIIKMHVKSTSWWMFECLLANVKIFIMICEKINNYFVITWIMINVIWYSFSYIYLDQSFLMYSILVSIVIFHIRKEVDNLKIYDFVYKYKIVKVIENLYIKEEDWG